MKYNLFLDDVRDPRSFPMGDRAMFRSLGGPLVLWAKDLDQAEAYLDAYGMPEVMYLDHDLGVVDNTMAFLKYAQQRWPNNPPETVIYLTANPVGEQNMKAFIRSWRKTAEDRPHGIDMHTA